MRTADFLDGLSAHGIRLWVEGDRLRYQAPSKAITDEILDELRRRKHEILTVLENGSDRELSDDTGQWGPLARGQEALWFIHQTVPESAAYNVAFAVRIRSEVNVEAMRRSLQRLVDQHPTLRTTYALRGDWPMQRVDPRHTVDFGQIDVTGLSEAELHKLAAEKYKEPFNLQTGPVFRARLLTRSHQDHVLLVVIHHIACDGWSLWILQEEFGEIYPAECRGGSRPLPLPKFSYGDFVRWQDSLISSPAGEEHWQYWQNVLAGDLPVLDLPTDRVRPKKPTFRGASHPFYISADLTQRLRAFAQTEGATLYMVLLAAYQVVLHRYCGQDEVLVGSPTSGRSCSESSGIVGYFVNPIVLRARIDGDGTFREHLSSVREAVLGALEHQDLPFPVLVERLRVQRQANRSPLFQALFAMQRPQMLADVVNLLSGDENQATLDWGGLRLEPFDLAQQEGQFEISLELMETGQSIYALLKYRTDLFDGEIVAGLSRHYCNLLEEIVDDSNRPVSDLPLADNDERHDVLTTFNQSCTAYPREQAIHRLFEAQVERHPDHVALVSGGSRVTYRDLNSRANQLAHHLCKLGVGPEVKVGICIERSVEMVISLLAILKAGGAYVPLDPDYPARRLEFMSEDSGASILIAGQRTADLLLDFDGNLVLLDQDAEQIAAESSDNLVTEIAADGLAYVMYTSGSTGTPKGVEVVHRGVVRLVCNTNYVKLGPDQVVLQFATLSFDASIFEIWGPLLNGGQLAIFPPGLPSINELGQFIQDHKVTTLWLTAGLFHQMVDFGLGYLRSVRHLLAGGDVVSPTHATKALEALNECQLINGYGPTENTTFTCCHVMNSPADVGPTVSIGRPIANTRVYVLDRYGKPVPVGVPGELYAAGDGLARGYLNCPQLTEERFLPDPFVEDATARMYRTGDLVRWHSDGSLVFLGRRDHQVKIRGFRIELGEIESALTGHNAVRNAVVVARDDHDGEQRLIAYVVPSADPPPSVDELRSFLRKRVPGYMVPSAVMILDELPLTANGKTDRAALPSVDRSRPIVQSEYVAPRTPMEKTMAAIWAEVLGLNRVGIHDNFFDLGGASIKSLRIVAKAQEAGLSLDPSVLSPELLFEHPTVAEVAALIESAAPATKDYTETKHE